jgi:hypothetical protein
VQEVLRGFYERAIETAKRQTGVSESRLRRWFKDKLITAAGTRGTVFQGKEQTEGIANSAVDVLEAQHIIRAERRAGARWYELTHDRLIEPIRKSNVEAQDRRFRSLMLRAALIAICTLTLITIISIKYFKTYRLTVEAVNGSVVVTAPDGSVVRDPCDASFRRGAKVTLEAVPYLNYRFDKWPDIPSETNDPNITLVMNKDKSVTAEFVKIYLLNANAINGSVTKDPDQEYYDVNDTITLTAVPNEKNYTFIGWSGDLPDNSNSNNTTLELVMDKHKSVTAVFRAPDNIKEVTLTARFDWYDTFDSRDKWITQGVDVDTGKIETSPGWQRSPMKFGGNVEFTSWCTRASSGQWRLYFNVPFVKLSFFPGVDSPLSQIKVFSQIKEDQIESMLSEPSDKDPIQRRGDYRYGRMDIFLFRTNGGAYAKMQVLSLNVRGESGYSRRGVLKIRYVVY